MHKSKHQSSTGHEDIVTRSADRSCVVHGAGYSLPGRVALALDDTGNGFIAKFPAFASCDQDYYVCLSYSQARDLILAMSAFKQELGFDA